MTRIEKWFLVIACCFGVIYGLIIPPFQAPDEVHHLYRTIHISQGNLFADITSDARLGGTLPNHYQEISDPFLRLRYNKNAKTNYKEISEIIGLTKNNHQTKFLDFPNVGYYAPINYLPQAFASWLIAPLNLNGIIILYVLRILGISIWILIIFLCIKICPKLKALWLLTSTLPAALFTHSGLSTDLMTHAMAFLALAIIFQMYFSRTYSFRNWITFALLCLALTYSRIIFAPFVLLGFLLNTNIFPSKKQYWSLNAANVFLIVLILCVQYKLLGESFIPYDQYNPLFRDGKQLNPGIDPTAQLNFIFREPVKFMGILINSWIEIMPFTMAHYLGKFGWEANYIPKSIMFLLLSGIIIQAVTIKINFNLLTRLKVMGVGLLCSLALSIVLYMQWEKVGASHITSLSGRYFVGIFPIFFISIIGIYPHKLKINYNAIMWIFAWIISMWCVFERYYR